MRNVKVFFCGASNEIRTRDLLFSKQTFYQLNYTRFLSRLISAFFPSRFWRGIFVSSSSGFFQTKISVLEPFTIYLYCILITLLTIFTNTNKKSVQTGIQANVIFTTSTNSMPCSLNILLLSSSRVACQDQILHQQYSKVNICLGFKYSIHVSRVGRKNPSTQDWYSELFV